ncbi:D-2-hydroxyacid dehydrogenase [Lentilactobacillus sp. Marseille-Q4993]|uniref:D-2-hydroxyacid dehydrogenase n=1 Tax=Lentilactobacillus sp. Marseille-Q4993 TaxID=3039492 RepID=UPI0024BCFB21|nr:D-2-hydroxyacid dehydrogenase [Lentilactobacillus sp. Marseille-Q4993]
MKILMYNTRDDEKAAIKQWVADNNIQVDMNDVPLSDETAKLAAGYDGIITQQHGSIGSEQVYKTLSSLGIKQIGLRITGFEIVDLELATKYGLKVTNVPAYSPRSVGELVLAHTMWLVRHMGVVSEREKVGDFTWTGIQSREIHDLTVGIIGVGKIGSAVARLFNALGAKIIAADPIKRPEISDIVEYVSHEEVFRTADVVTLHTPLTEETHHMINERTLSLMKPTAFLINASRGPVIDTPALLAALKSGEIAGAALDTFEGEQTVVNQDLTETGLNDPVLKELFAMPNVNVSPHIGFYTDVAVSNMITISLDNVVLILKGNGDGHLVNPAVLNRGEVVTK